MESVILISATQKEINKAFAESKAFSIRSFEEVKTGLYDVRVRHKEIPNYLDGTYTLDGVRLALEQSKMDDEPVKEMTIKELGEIMKAHGVSLRAVPNKVVHILETSHAYKYPEGKIEYLDDYKRDMLILEEVPAHAGEFVFKKHCGTSSTVKFTGKRFYDTIEAAIADLLETSNKG